MSDDGDDDDGGSGGAAFNGKADTGNADEWQDAHAIRLTCVRCHCRRKVRPCAATRDKNARARLRCGDLADTTCNDPCDWCGEWECDDACLSME